MICTEFPFVSANRVTFGDPFGRATTVISPDSGRRYSSSDIWLWQRHSACHEEYRICPPTRLYRTVPEPSLAPTKRNNASSGSGQSNIRKGSFFAPKERTDDHKSFGDSSARNYIYDRNSAVKELPPLPTQLRNPWRRNSTGTIDPNVVDSNRKSWSWVRGRNLLGTQQVRKPQGRFAAVAPWRAGTSKEIDSSVCCTNCSASLARQEARLQEMRMKEIRLQEAQLNRKCGTVDNILLETIMPRMTSGMTPRRPLRATPRNLLGTENGESNIEACRELLMNYAFPSMSKHRTRGDTTPTPWTSDGPHDAMSHAADKQYSDRSSSPNPRSREQLRETSPKSLSLQHQQSPEQDDRAKKRPQMATTTDKLGNKCIQFLHHHRTYKHQDAGKHVRLEETHLEKSGEQETHLQRSSSTSSSASTATSSTPGTPNHRMKMTPPTILKPCLRQRNPTCGESNRPNGSKGDSSAVSFLPYCRVVFYSSALPPSRLLVNRKNQ